MTTEGSRTDDASETSAAHCPGRTPPSLADDEGNTTQLLALAFAGIMLLPFSIGGVFGAYLAGGFVAGSETEPLIEWAGWRSSTGGYSWSDSVDTARTPWRSVPTTSTAC